MDKIVIFGMGEIAQIANYYFQIDSPYEVVAFTLDKEYIKSENYEENPMVDFNVIEEIYPPSEYKMFIALSYSKMNKIREEKYYQAKSLGYHLVSYISSKCSYMTRYKHGDNCFIFEDNTIQPYVKIGNNVTLWSGNHIGHHSIIKDHNFISSHVVISGSCVIENNCFLGVNSTVGHKITLAKETLLGAGSVITKNTEEKAIYLPPRSIKLDKRSDQIKI
ncbi:MAG: acetyltransferase [Flavobacteriales bacterium TMED84]|nr:sugar O-acyltransferase [Crocinitomicaceae bacterium]RPG53392.1 MAG: acetyltransferase [Flavobacteriales bacterium TMED84]